LAQSPSFSQSAAALLGACETMANISVWLSVKGSTPLRVKCAEGDLVEDLKVKVKSASKPALDPIPVFNIDIYMSKEAYEVVDHKALLTLLVCTWALACVWKPLGLHFFVS
jgi:hypothetical protein